MSSPAHSPSGSPVGSALTAVLAHSVPSDADPEAPSKSSPVTQQKAALPPLSASPKGGLPPLSPTQKPGSLSPSPLSPSPLAPRDRTESQHALLAPAPFSPAEVEQPQPRTITPPKKAKEKKEKKSRSRRNSTSKKASAAIVAESLQNTAAAEEVAAGPANVPAPTKRKKKKKKPAAADLQRQPQDHLEQQPLMKGDLEMGQTKALSDMMNELPKDPAQEPEQQPEGADAAEADANPDAPAEAEEEDDSDSEEIGFYYLCGHGLIDEVYKEVMDDSSELTEDRDYEGCSGLHIACREGQVGVVQLLLGQPVTGKNGMLQLPVEKTVSREMLEQTRLRDRYENTPLLSACRNCNVLSETEGEPNPSFTIVKLLLEHGSPCTGLQLDEKTGITPLHWAAYHGQADLVRLLLEHSADPLRKAQTVGNKFSIDLAGVVNNQRKSKGDRLAKIKEDGRTELNSKHKAFLACNHVACVQLIIERGLSILQDPTVMEHSDVHKQRFYLAMFFWSCSLGLFQEAKTLMKSRGQYTFDALDDYPGDHSTWSPIHECAKQGWAELLHELLESAQARHEEPLPSLATWSSADENYTPLHVACIFRNFEAAKQIKEWCEKKGKACISRELSRQTASGHTARDFWDDGTNRVFFSLAEHANSEATWEYVLVFKNSAKIMHVLDEMLTSTTNGACLITKVVAAKTINAHTGDKILFLLVSASDQVIFQHAQKIGLMMRKRETHAYSAFKAAKAEDFEPMRCTERQQVVMSLMKTNFDVDSLQMEGTIDDLFPLHTRAIQDELRKKWWYNTRKDESQFPPIGFMKELLFDRDTNKFLALNTCFRYMGSPHALYFGWTCLFTTALIFVAPFAVMMLLHQVLSSDVNSFLSPYYMIVICMWATLFTEQWKRKQSELVTTWSLKAHDRELAPSRPEFKGNVVIVEPNLKIEKRFPSTMRSRNIACTMAVTVAMLALVCSGFWTLRMLREMDNFKDNTMIVTGFSMANGCFVAVLNIIYLEIAAQMTTWENHRTQQDHDDAFIGKTAAFQFINSFAPIFITAYGDLNQGTLMSLIISSSLVLQLADAGIAFVLPWFKLKAKMKLNGIEFDGIFSVLKSSPLDASVQPEEESDVEDQLVAELELQYCQEPPPDLVQIYSSKVVLMGFVILFAPLGAVTALHVCLLGIVLIRIEMIAFVYCYRRGHTINAADIGIWLTIIELLAFVAVTNNCAYLYLATKQLDDYADERSSQLWIIVVVEHVILYLRGYLAAVVSDVPEYIQMKKLAIHERDTLQKAENKKIKEMAKKSEKDE